LPLVVVGGQNKVNGKKLPFTLIASSDATKAERLGLSFGTSVTVMTVAVDHSLGGFSM